MGSKKTRLERFKGRSAEDVFTEIYDKDDWGSTESKSGKGSTLERTSIIRKQLPDFFKKYNIKRLYDGACGDFNWMSKLVENLDFYTGTDIVEKMVKDNTEKYSNESIKFRAENISIHQIENGYDAIFLRDVLVHLPIKDAIKALENVKKSGAKYLIATNFREISENEDLQANGLWRPINLEIKPFDLGEPLESMHESNQTYEYKNKMYTDKYLSIWELNK
jgi:SAM-dependent methyltransferase